MMNTIHEFSLWEREEWFGSPNLFIVGVGIVGASVALVYKEHHPDYNMLIAEGGFTPYGTSVK